MQKIEARRSQLPQQPAQRQGGGTALESPQGEQNAQLEAMAERSPLVGKQAQLAVMVNNSQAARAQRRVMEMMHHGAHAIAQRKAVECVQGQFTLEGHPLVTVRHLGPIERWVRNYHPEAIEDFTRIKNDSESEPVDIDAWLNRNFRESYQAISRADSAMEDCLGIERMDGGGSEPPSVVLAYGEESCRGALAEVRRDPSLARRGNRYIATTPSGQFPDDAESRMAREELIARGAETLVGVDVQQSPLDADAAVPFNTTDLRFRYPRTDRGSRPSTSDIVSSFVDRAAETGRGELAIPTPAMYDGSAATRNRLYGANRFEATMEQRGMGISEVRPGPEASSELAPFGYAHRMTGREQERDGGVMGKTLVMGPGDGSRKMDKDDDVPGSEF